MFDLIDECGKDLKCIGYKVKKLYDGKLSYASLNIDDDKKAEDFSLEKGEYHILTVPNLYDNADNLEILQKEMIKIIKSLLKKSKITKNSSVLIVGLGNSDIECDRLGKEVFDRIEISPLNKNNKLFKFCPNIFFLTGINAIDLTKMLVDKFDIDLVILIDSLTTSNISRLGTSFQITTAGLTPGSGVHRFGKKISQNELGIKTLSIGVPFMINSNTFDKGKKEVLLCPKDISSNVAIAGEIIASSIKEVIR